MDMVLGILDRVNKTERRRDNVLRDRNHPLRQKIGFLKSSNIFLSYCS